MFYVDQITDSNALPRDNAKRYGQPALYIGFADNGKTQSALRVAKNSVGAWDIVVHVGAPSYLVAQLTIRDIRSAIEAEITSSQLPRANLRIVTPDGGETFDRQRAFERGWNEDLLALRRLYLNDVPAELLPAVSNVIIGRLAGNDSSQAGTAVTDYMNGVQDAENIRVESGWRFVLSDLCSRITGKGALSRTRCDLHDQRGRFAIGYLASLSR